MEKVTAEQCKQVVAENEMTWLGHHRCGCCGSMVGFTFARAGDVLADAHDFTESGIAGPDDTAVAFDPSCGCNSLGGPELRSWDNFAETFNMQTPEIREKMWTRFKAGKTTHESD